MAERTADDLPSDQLVDGLGQVARRLRAAAMEAFSVYEVTPSQVRALRVLASHGGVRSSELAAHLKIAPRSATEVVDALAAKDLVRREADPSDRRAVVVSLTDRGAGLTEEVRRAREDEAERLTARLTRTDRDDLARILRKLLAE